MGRFDISPEVEQKRSGVEVKDQVAESDRSGMRAADARSTTKRVTIETADGDEIVCDAEGLGHNPGPTT